MDKKQNALTVAMDQNRPPDFAPAWLSFPSEQPKSSKGQPPNDINLHQRSFSTSDTYQKWGAVKIKGRGGGPSQGDWNAAQSLIYPPRQRSLDDELGGGGQEGPENGLGRRHGEGALGGGRGHRGSSRGGVRYNGYAESRGEGSGGYGPRSTAKEAEKEEAANGETVVTNGKRRVKNGSGFFNQEFPSLPGSSSMPGSSKKSGGNGSVWEKPPSPFSSSNSGHLMNLGGQRKMHLVQRASAPPSSGGANELLPGGQAVGAHSEKAAGNQMYKSLVPSKASKNAPLKLTTKTASISNCSLTGGGSSGGGVNGSLATNTSSVGNPTLSTMSSTTLKEGSRPTATLTTPIVITSKVKRVDGRKSDFLRELKKGNPPQEKTNGVEKDATQLGPQTNHMDAGPAQPKEEEGGAVPANRQTSKLELSTSLEAERRFLLDLGWEEDVDVEPLTEEELKEFKKQTPRNNNHLHQLNQCNGVSKKLLPTWQQKFGSISLEDSVTDEDSSDDDEH